MLIMNMIVSVIIENFVDHCKQVKMLYKSIYLALRAELIKIKDMYI